MAFIRSALASVAVAGLVMSGQVAAQTAGPDTTAPPARDDSTTAKIRSKADDVAKWSTKEWNKAKAEWAKEKDKWADCQKQSKDQGLTGRKSWAFLSSCMTSSS